LAAAIPSSRRVAEEESMASDLSIALAAVGQLLLGGFFVIAGLRHFSMVPTITGMIAARGVPVPHLTFLAGTLFQVAAGACLMLGIWVAAAAMGLVLFTVAASAMLLNFWDLEGPPREAAITGWQSNLAIIGGLLITAAHAP
jgi:putative oxidoreductase